MTLVELLVAITAGTMVMAGITAALIVTLRDTTRVTSHIDANQQARAEMSEGDRRAPFRLRRL